MTFQPSPEAFRRAHRAAHPAQKSPRRVYSLLRSSIYSGDIVPEDRLVEEELMHTFATSRNAVREALAMLAADGLVTRSTRIGTMVVRDITTHTIEGFRAVKESPSEKARFQQVESTIVPASRLLKSKLATNDDTIQLVEFMIFRGQVPFSLHTGYSIVGAEHLDYSDINTEWTLHHAFERAHGVPLTHIETHISATTTDARTSRKLGVAPDSTTLMRARLLSDATGEHREYGYTYFVEPNFVMRSDVSLVGGVWQNSGDGGPTAEL